MRDGAWRLTLGAALACAAGLGVVVAVVALAAGALGIGSLLHVAVEESPGPSGSTRGRVDSSTAPATADDRVTRSGEPEPEPEPGREPAVDPSAAIPGFTFVETNAAGYPEFQHDESGIVFVRLPGGNFEMGSPPDEEGRGDDEGPVRSVELSSFLIAKYEVTQAQFRKVTGTNPSAFEGDDSRPVESVTWTELHAEDGFLARTGLWLPSEAQWEYACRGGASGPYAGTGKLDDTGWYRSDADPPTSPQPVGGKQPNGFGLHDMHGNVYEWCEDVYDAGFYARPEASLQDPQSLGNSGRKVSRGGAWDRRPFTCRSANRARTSADFRAIFMGFRVAFRPPP